MDDTSSHWTKIKSNHPGARHCAVVLGRWSWGIEFPPVDPPYSISNKLWQLDAGSATPLLRLTCSRHVPFDCVRKLHTGVMTLRINSLIRLTGRHMTNNTDAFRLPQCAEGIMGLC